MPAEIVGVGLVTPLGVNARAAAAAIRAGLVAMRESSIRDLNLDPLVMGLVPDVLPPIEALGVSARHARLVRLAAPAAAEAARDAPGEPPLAAFVGLPEPPAGRRDPIGQGFLADLAHASAVPLDLRASRVFRQGRAAALFALDAALDHLTRTRASYALVGGVDSYVDLRVLGELELEGRVRTRGVSDAFIPGEGAGFVLLSARGRRRHEAFAEVASTATGKERGHLYSDEPYLGDGLAETVAATFAGTPSAPPVRTVYVSFNGESFWAKEWGVAQIRSTARFAPDAALEHPADSIGDPGAASGAIMLGLSAIGLARGYRKGPALVLGSADRGERAAALLCTIRR